MEQFESYREPNKDIPAIRQAPKWTDQDKRTASELLGRANTYDHSMFKEKARLGKAALSLGYTGYDDQKLQGVIAYIQSQKVNSPNNSENRVNAWLVDFEQQINEEGSDISHVHKDIPDSKLLEN